MKTPQGGTKPRYEIFKSVSYFSALEDERTMAAITNAAIRRTYRANQVIMIEGEPSRGFYIVESGWLKVAKYSFEGREQILKTLGPGDSFNAIGVFTDTPNPAGITALETAVVWFIPREAMLRLLDENPTLAKIIIQDLASKVTHLVELIEDLSLRSVESRLARLLLKHAENEVLSRRRWATQAEMANRIGTVPDVVNRTLRKLAEAGLIEVSRHQIQIIDRNGLKQIADIQL